MFFRMKNNGGLLEPAVTLEESCWVHLENPTNEEQEEFKQLTGLPAYLLKDAMDADEMPHVDMYSGGQVVFVDVPVATQEVPKNQTRPLCIILGKDKLYSITGCEFGLVHNLKADHIEQLEDTKDIFLVILWTVMAEYIRSLKAMENASNWNHDSFKNPTQKENVFFELLDHQKSLIDYKTSIETNHITLVSLQEILEQELNRYQKLMLSNLIVESQQIAQMCGVFGEVLSATAGIAESIVSNNLNDLMKTLTSLTIIVSLPTIISGMYMTNTQIPAPFNHYLVPVFLSVSLVAVAYVLFKKRRML